MVEVTGRVDPVVGDFVVRSLRRAERTGSQVLVLQLDSPGAALSTGDLDVLAFHLTHASVPVAVWVGPSGAHAYGASVRLLAAGAVSGMAQGAHVGRARGLCPPGYRIRSTGRCGHPLYTSRTLSSGAARARGAVEMVAPTLGDFLVGLDGQTLGGRTLQTARVVDRGGQPRREPAVRVRFAQLGLTERLLHAAANPQVAYLLLVAGLALIVFEFFTAGVGVAGGVGAGALVLACYGLAVLPTTALGLALVAVGIAGFAIDVQAGTPRAWTAIGTVALVAGSVRLYGADVSLPVVSVLLVVVGVILFVVAGMPGVVRARFSTPTIGRGSMIGEMGEATTGIDPDGMVRLRGGFWRARTNRATPIASGAPVRVVGIDGLVLEVEPEEGGAREARH